MLNFNLRPYVRGDVALFLPLRELFDFNSRPCVRGDCRC